MDTSISFPPAFALEACRFPSPLFRSRFKRNSPIQPRTTISSCPSSLAIFALRTGNWSLWRNSFQVLFLGAARHWVCGTLHGRVHHTSSVFERQARPLLSAVRRGSHRSAHLWRLLGGHLPAM